MAVRVNIKNLDAIRRNALNHVRASVLPKITKVVRDRAREQVPDLLIESVKRTDVYRGIRGDFNGEFDKDIQAHLGLLPENISSILSELEDQVRASVVVKASRVSAEIEITLSKLENNVRGMVTGSYTSNPSGLQIDWINWILDGNTTVSAFIKFDEDGSWFEAISRSGRAIMVEAPGQHWHVRDVIGEDPRNFLQQAVNDPVFLSQLSRLVIKEFLKEIKKYG